MLKLLTGGWGGTLGKKSPRVNLFGLYTPCPFVTEKYSGIISENLRKSFRKIFGNPFR
jgi:hypothetical protein